MTDSTAIQWSPLRLQGRLYLMMFLQYFVQGCYLPIISIYLQDALKFSPFQIGLFGSALAVGPLLAPFVIGQVVDRYLPTQHVLAVSHVLAAGLMLVLYTQKAVVPVVILGTIYSILYIPTLMLTNSLSLYHLRNRNWEFPLVRLFGTVGFIAPAWVIELYLLRGLTGDELNDGRRVVLLLSGLAEIVLAFYCLTLPSTPPRRELAQRYAPGLVLGLMRRRDFQVLVGVGLFVAVCHKFFFVWSGPYLKWFLREVDIQVAIEQRLLAIGQISEVLVFLGLGLAISRLGFKWTLTIGGLAYALRCLIFAQIPLLVDTMQMSALPIVCLGLALHGLCFACFWAVGFIYVDRVAPADIRGSMQTFYGTFVFGTGMFVGGFVAGGVGQQFKESQDVAAHVHIVAQGLDAQSLAPVAGPMAAAGKMTIAANIAKSNAFADVYDWTAIWLICAGIAAVGIAAFVAMFPRRKGEQPIV